MATVNKRIRKPMSQTINGVSSGGLVSHKISIGYDDVNQNPVDGYALSMADLLTEFVRGRCVSQDWIKIIQILTGTISTDVFYERKSGVADASGYVKHTLNNPVVHRFALDIVHRKYATAEYSYECRAADETKGITDMWEKDDSQNAPDCIPSARGLEITACVHGSQAIYHVTRLQLIVELLLTKASHDGDVGYTAVDADEISIKAYGTLYFQDASVANGYNIAAKLVTTERDNLVCTIRQSQGATAKTLTIAGVRFTFADHDTNADSDNYDEFSLPFIITNNFTTPLTLAGANKIITIL